MEAVGFKCSPQTKEALQKAADEAKTTLSAYVNEMACRNLVASQPTRGTELLASILKTQQEILLLLTEALPVTTRLPRRPDLFTAVPPVTEWPIIVSPWRGMGVNTRSVAEELYAIYGNKMFKFGRGCDNLAIAEKHRVFHYTSFITGLHNRKLANVTRISRGVYWVQFTFTEGK